MHTSKQACMRVAGLHVGEDWGWESACKGLDPHLSPLFRSLCSGFLILAYFALWAAVRRMDK